MKRIALLLLLCSSAYGQTITFILPHECPDAKVVRRGDVIIVRCQGKDWLTLQPGTCPNARVTRDQNANLTLRC